MSSLRNINVTVLKQYCAINKACWLICNKKARNMANSEQYTVCILWFCLPRPDFSQMFPVSLWASFQ